MTEPFEGWIDDPDVIKQAISMSTGWERLYLTLYLGEVLDRKVESND